MMYFENLVVYLEALKKIVEDPKKLISEKKVRKIEMYIDQNQEAVNQMSQGKGEIWTLDAQSGFEVVNKTIKFLKGGLNSNIQE